MIHVAVVGALALGSGARFNAGSIPVDLTGSQAELLRGAAVTGGVLRMTSKQGSGFNEFLHTTEKLRFLGGADAAVSFQYTYTCGDRDGRAYALFRSRSAEPVHDRDVGWINLREGSGTARLQARLPFFDDYYLVIGIHGGGSIEVTNLSVNPGSGGLKRITPEPDLSVLTNPDKGWVLHFYDNNITNYGSRMRLEDPVEFPGLSMVYFRLAWSYLEPTEGVLDWSMIDPWYEKFTRLGLAVSFRISCSETPVKYATPAWVKAAGATFHPFARGDQRAPEFSDPIFLAKLDSFLERFAARFDQDPKVLWMDVGSLGVWGEGHTYHSTRRPIPLEVQKRHLDLHAKHFKSVTLIINDDYGEAAVKYARGLGFGLRDDSICVNPQRPYFHANMAEWFWRERPVVVETEHYGPSLRRGAWNSDTVTRSVEEYHASWVSIHWWHDEFLAKERPLVEKLANRMGYWLFVNEAVVPRELRQGQAFCVDLTWENRGVAPMYVERAVAVSLKSTTGRVVWSGASTSSDTRRWLPGTPVRTFHSFHVPRDLAPGDYHLCIGLCPKGGPIRPEIALALKGRDTDRWHRITRIRVVR